MPFHQDGAQGSEISRVNVLRLIETVSDRRCRSRFPKYGDTRLCMDGFSTASAAQALFALGITLKRTASCLRSACASCHPTARPLFTRQVN